MLPVLLAAAWTDIRFQRVPNRVLLAALAGRGVIGLFGLLQTIWESGRTAGRMGVQMVWQMAVQMGRGSVPELAGCILLMTALSIPAWFQRGSLGMGDVKLMGILALYCGAWEAFFCLYWALLVAAFLCLVLLAAGRIGRSSRLAFAPFLLAGYCIRLLQ